MVVWGQGNSTTGAPFDMRHDIGGTVQDQHAQHSFGAPQIQPLDIFGMIRVLWHGKWVVMLATLFMTLLAGYYVFRIAAPQYVATAIVQLDQINEDARLPDVTTTQELSLNTVVAQVTSDVVLARSVASLDLLNDPEFNRYLIPANTFGLANLRTTLRHRIAGTQEPIRDDAYVLDKTVQNLRGALRTVRQKDTYMLQISARSGDPAKAATLANSAATAFLEHIETMQEQTRAEAEHWLETRVSALRLQLETEELAIAALIATAQIQEDSVIDRLSADVLATDQQLGSARTTLAVMEQSPDSGTARKRAEIAQIQTTINDLTALKNRLSAQLSAQSAGLAQLHQIQLQADTTRQLYQEFLGRLQENKMQQSLQTPHARSFAPASEGQYIGPRKILILTIAAMLGAAMGVVLVAVMHCTRRGVIDAKGLRDATGLPVVAQLSQRVLRPMRKGKRSFPLPPQAPLKQAMQGLYTALSLVSRGASVQTILCTSSIRNEGASEQALALTHTLASAGKTVVLIGANSQNTVLRAAIDRHIFQHAQTHWPTVTALAHDSGLGADVVIIGKGQDQVGSLLTDQMSDVFATLQRTYDHIIIDGPPVLLAPEAPLFAQHADAILYTVQWSKTSLDLVMRGLEALKDNGSPATGLVLSKVNPRKMRQLSTDPCIGAISTAQIA